MSELSTYYPVHISSHGRTSLRWGKRCERPSEARQLLKAEIAAGTASMGFVVRFSDAGKAVLHQYTEPASARKIIGHLLDLEDALDNPPV